MLDTQAPDTSSGMLIVDTDSHYCEPPDLWTSRAPRNWRDRVLHVREVDGQRAWFIDGKPFIPVVNSSVIRKDGSKLLGTSFLRQRFEELHPATHEVDARLALLDEMGIQKQLIYGNVLGFSHAAAAKIDPALRLMCTQIYNDAMAEMQAQSGERLFPMAMTPWWDTIDVAVDEIRRVHALGLRGVNMTSEPCDIGKPDLADRYWDPLWAVCSDLELPINFHIGNSESQMSWFADGPWPSLKADLELQFAVGSSMIFYANAKTLANLLVSGILERFPKVQFVSVESGLGWIPNLLEALDYQCSQIDQRSLQHLSMRPSDYFKRQVHACFWFETQDLSELVTRVGADRVMFETDFPHPTCLYPDPVTRAEAELTGLSREDRRKVMGGNAIKLYKLDANVGSARATA